MGEGVLVNGGGLMEKMGRDIEKLKTGGKAWRQNMTLEQRAEWIRKIKEGRLKNKAIREGLGKKSGRKSFTGIQMNVHSIRTGLYVKGTSRTLLLDNLMVDVDDFVEELMGWLEKVKEKGLKARVRKETTKVIIF